MDATMGMTKSKPAASDKGKKGSSSSKGNMFIKHGGVEVAGSSDGYYPSFTVTEKAVPELMDKKVSETCSLIVTGKIKSVNANDTGDTRIEFEVHNAEYNDDKGKKAEKKDDTMMAYDKPAMKKAAGAMQKIKKMRKA